MQGVTLVPSVPSATIARVVLSARVVPIVPVVPVMRAVDGKRAGRENVHVRKYVRQSCQSCQSCCSARVLLCLCASLRTYTRGNLNTHARTCDAWEPAHVRTYHRGGNGDKRACLEQSTWLRTDARRRDIQSAPTQEVGRRERARLLRTMRSQSAYVSADTYVHVHARVRMYRVPLCPHQKDMLRTYVPNIPASGAWLTASAATPIS